MTAPLMYEMHMHTPLCKHARGEVEEYAAVAESRNMRGIVVTCHNPMPDGYSAPVRMDIEQFDQYQAMVQRARDAFAGRLDVRLGLECDYYPGAEPWLEAQLQWAEFHHVLGSIHPHLPEHRAKYYTGDDEAYRVLYFDHLAQAAETGLFDTLSHPDLVKNEAPGTWRLDRTMPHIESALDRIARTGVAMELNTSGLHKAIPEMNPSFPMLQRMQERGIPVVIGADAHTPERVGKHFEQALHLLGEAGYSHVSLVLDRQRRDLPVDDALASLVQLTPTTAEPNSA